MSASTPQATPGNPPDALLDHLSQLRRQARARSRGAWLPLLVFALLTLASTLLYRQPFYTPPASGASYGVELPSYAGLPWSQQSAALSIAFWLALAPLCYLGCALWYQWHAERSGVSLRWQTWVWAGLALFGVLVVVLVGQRLGWLRLVYGPPSGAMEHTPDSALSPLLAIALGLLVLAQVERSRGVAITAITYGGLAMVMNLYGLGQIPPWILPPLGGSIDAFVAAGPNLILLAAILLLGAAFTGKRRAGSARQTARPL